jgi:cellulose synthase/poly-beta-1,6-N-acetylglucosamine synthase-like glycosyltransferase
MSFSDTLWAICYLPVVLGLSAFGAHRFVMVYLFLKYSKNKPKPLGELAEWPQVTVQLPVFNEQHDYPKDRLQIQLLDDSTDETVELSRGKVAELQALGFAAEFVHRTDRTGYKAGALENGLTTATGEFVFILDADFIPPPGILQQMLPFFTDPKIALVQTRWGHLNRGFSLLTRVQALFLDGHLMVEQTARSRAGRFFNFNGTGGVWRKAAIADAGGWEHDTLTEDLDLSYRAQMKGWKFIFLNDVVTPAELPVDMNGFKSQQHRWTKGSIQAWKKLIGPLWRAKIPLIMKLEGTVHLGANFAYLLLIALCLLVWPGMGAGFNLGGWRMWVLDLPVFIASSVSVGCFYTVSQWGLWKVNPVEHRGWWKQLIYLPALLALGVGMAINNGKAVIEALLNQQSGFVRTPKYGIEKKGEAWQGKKYSIGKSLWVMLELVFALYFTAAAVKATGMHSWSSAPFLAMFASGFWYAAGGTLLQSWGRSKALAVAGATRAADVITADGE